MYDVTKILSTLKGKRGEHRAFRLAENLCMNLILSLREFFFVRKDTKVRYLLFSYWKYIFLPQLWVDMVFVMGQNGYEQKMLKRKQVK